MLKEKNSSYGITRSGEVWTFDTYEEFVTYSKTAIPLNEGSQDTDRADWYGTSSFNEAVQLATTGWPEGRDKLGKALISTQAAIATGRAPAFDMDVGGAYPVVPEYVSGNPAHMMTTIETQTAARPIVRLLINMVIAANIYPDALTRAYGALLSWIDALEDAGNSVELRGAFVSNGWNEDQSTMLVTLKHAGEILELDRLAFSLTHPSNVRRIWFGALEAQCAELGNWSSYSSTYGQVTEPEERIKEEPGVIFLPGMAHRGASNGAVKTPEKAAKYIEEQIAATETGRAYIEAAKEQA